MGGKRLYGRYMGTVSLLLMPFCPYCDFQIALTDAQFCPHCGKAIAMQSTAPQYTQSPSQTNQPLPLAPEPKGRWLLLPGERIAWEKDFKEGLIHRHVERAYVITNHRVVSVDVVNRQVISSLPLRDTDLVVMDRHTSSTSTGVGSYHDGAGTMVRSGTSKSIGTIVFVTNGVERIKLGGIGDPDGVKNLFVTLKHDAP
jgi:hypothetical protein